MLKTHLNKKELEKLEREVRNLRRSNEEEEGELREGQMYMIALYDVSKEVYNRILGTPIDPFYNSKLVPLFLKEIDITNNKVWAPAIWFKIGIELNLPFQPFNTEDGIVLTGMTWESIREIAENIFPSYISKERTVEGFITIKNEFLTKKESTKRAYKFNQIKSTHEELKPSDLIGG